MIWAWFISFLLRWFQLTTRPWFLTFFIASVLIERDLLWLIFWSYLFNLPLFNNMGLNRPQLNIYQSLIIYFCFLFILKLEWISLTLVKCFLSLFFLLFFLSFHLNIYIYIFIEWFILFRHFFQNLMFL